jgi:RNA polymerase sigma factor (TIGR02999 family)
VSDITLLLHAHGAGDAAAFDRLVPFVYDELRRLARAQLRRRGGRESLETAGLVHEAYMKLVDQTRATWRDRGHFFAVAAMAMRQIIVDHARRRTRAKRGGDQPVASLDTVHEPAAKDVQDVLDVDRALSKLASVDARLARVVECRYFAGLTEEETAAALGISVRTTQREWLKARAWLRGELAR